MVEMFATPTMGSMMRLAPEFEATWGADRLMNSDSLHCGVSQAFGQKFKC